MNKVWCVSVSFTFFMVVLMRGVFVLVMIVRFLFVVVVVMWNNRMREHQHVCGKQTEKNEIFIAHRIQM